MSAPLLLWAACIDNELKPDGTLPWDSASQSDSTTRLDTRDSEVTDPVVECPDAAPGDATASASDACSQAPVEDWELRVRWQEVSVGILDDPHLVRPGDVGEPMDVWAFEAREDQILQYPADGRSVTARVTNARTATGASGDVGWGDGGEIVVLVLEQDPPRTWIGVFDETATLAEWDVAAGSSYPLWLYDAGGDGDAEVLAAGQVVDLATGEVETALEGTDTGAYWGGAAADLDRDGLDEVVAVHGNPARTSLFEDDGSFVATCREDAGYPIGYAPVAIGNLDDDGDGEFVTAGAGYVAVCDTDGTILLESDVGATEVATLGLAELDGDASAEIVVGAEDEIVAMDADLTVLWRFTGECNGTWRVFSVSDLDADGRHEVLVHACETLWIVSGDGELLASIVVGVGDADSGAQRNQPMVADIDGDGLAEIIVPDEAMTVVENATGGWVVAESDIPWHGVGRRPGDRGPNGSIPAPEPFWLEPGANVWQGTPAGPPAGVDLAVQVAGVCVESCTGEAVVTVAVGNEGATSTPGDVAVRVVSRADGTDLGDAVVVGPLAPGVLRYATTRVAADALVLGISATVDDASDCDPSDDLAEWLEGACW